MNLTGGKKSMPGVLPMLCLYTCWRNSLTWKGQFSKQNGDLKTSNDYLFPRGVIDISVYLKKSPVHAILSSSGGVIRVIYF